MAIFTFLDYTIRYARRQSKKKRSGTMILCI